MADVVPGEVVDRRAAFVIGGGALFLGLVGLIPWWRLQPPSTSPAPTCVSSQPPRPAPIPAAPPAVVQPPPPETFLDGRGMLRHHLEGARAVEGDISEIVITEDEVVVVHQPPKGKPQRSVVRVGASYAVELSQLLGRQTFAISEVKLAILDAVAANTGHLLKMPVARVVVSRSPGAESVHAIAYAAKASYTTTDVFVEWDLTSGDVLKRVTL